MFTIKQLEALHWVGELGGFEAAALRLHVSQSTISKRIAEIEARFTEPLFDRSGRSAIMTTQGRDLLKIADEMLRLNDRLVAWAQRDHAIPDRFTVGVTDLIALSWMPDLMKSLSDQFPETEIEPEIDLTHSLTDRLQRRELDLIICPQVPASPDFLYSRIGNIKLDLLASPSLTGGRSALSRAELRDFTLLTQSSHSVLFETIKPIVSDSKLRFRRYTYCNNMAALAELAAAGLGVTLLPPAFFRRHIDSGRLIVIEAELDLPSIEYYVSHHLNYYRNFSDTVVKLCQDVAEFRQPSVIATGL